MANIYNKPAIEISQQIAQLKIRGLTIDDERFAEYYLSHISYYRLAGYWWPMQSDKVQHIFKPDSKFDDVINLYRFDKELRLLIFDAIESIEVSFRTKLIHILSQVYSPWWFEDITLFQNKDFHNDTLNHIDSELDRSKEIFILDHKKKYWEDTRRPPSWKTLKIVTLGNLSKLYGNLKSSLPEKDIIAQTFGVANFTYFHSWMQGINQIRNICAHHHRLWNKRLPTKFKFMPKPKHDWIINIPPEPDRNRLYSALCCIYFLLRSIDMKNDFSFKLRVLFAKYTNVDPKAMGFMNDWTKEPLWKD